MSDSIPLTKAQLPLSHSVRAATLSRFRLGDLLFRNATMVSAYGVLILLSGVIVSLFIGAAPALHEFGFGFLVSENGIRSPKILVHFHL